MVKVLLTSQNRNPTDGGADKHQHKSGNGEKDIGPAEKQMLQSRTDNCKPKLSQEGNRIRDAMTGASRAR
jgi:hypothetical protein